MLGRTERQGDLFEADNLYRDYVGERSLYVALGRLRSCFQDDDFADLYDEGNGRPSVPPSELCMLMVLQFLHGVSDQEAVDRAAYDLRWKVALGLQVDEKLCSKSTLQLFRARLVIHERHGQILERSVEVCRSAGLLRRGELEAAIDGTPILGRGAVKDTFNLISDQIRRIVRLVAELQGRDARELAAEHGLERHFASSFKGAAEIDWDSKQAQRALVGQLVEEARGACKLGADALRQPIAEDIHPKKSGSLRRKLGESLELLQSLVHQDIHEEPEDGEGPEIRRGTAKDRIISTTDPEMRHGRNSPTKTVEGYKATVVADTESGTILATSIAPANQAEVAAARATLDQAQANLGHESVIERVIADTAYGTSSCRSELSTSGIELIAKSPPAGGKVNCFRVDDFRFDSVSGQATCPAGQVSAPGCPKKSGEVVYRFAESACSACPMRSQCTTAKGGRSVRVTPETLAHQEHRRRQQTPAFKEVYRRRVRVEHAIARLIQLGARQARYLGRAKVEFQLAMTAAARNLAAAAIDHLRELLHLTMLIIHQAPRSALLRGRDRNGAANATPPRLSPVGVPRTDFSRLPTRSLAEIGGCRPRF